MRKAGMFDTHRSGATIERAVTVSALKEAYSLVHDVYVDKGYIQPCAGNARVRKFEALPETATFIARVRGRIVAVTSLVPDSPDLGLPSDHTFCAELGLLRSEPGKVCEISNLAVAPEYRRTSVFLQLTQACFAHALATGCGNLFIAISPGHVPFFRDILQFEPWGPRRCYCEEVEDIVEGMKLCIPEVESLGRQLDHQIGPEGAFLYDFYFATNPYHGHVRNWAAWADGTFSDPLMLKAFLHFCSRLLERCDIDEIDAVRRHWDYRVLWSGRGAPQAYASGVGVPGPAYQTSVA
jgi:hypothetical protein